MAKLYTKKVWHNDQTKLSAKNMNRIEDGIEALAEEIDRINSEGIGKENIHTHDNKAILDATTVAFTEEIQNAINSKSVVSVSSNGTTSNTVQYITVNGIEYKLAGDLATHYEEINNVSLNSLKDTGVYLINNAQDVPNGTAPNGILNVTSLSNGTAAQDWLSTTNRAVRIFDENAESLKFFVNGLLVSQGTVFLNAGGTYELAGDLIGHIVIGEQETAVNNRTKVILKGVHIQSDDYESCLEYTPSAGKLVVEVADNSANYLVVNVEGKTGDEDKGAIHSENNLMINGVGYLTVINHKGHGIKGSELVINGNIHSYLDTNHDAVHGGKLLKITGGYFEVANANDAFSASSGKSNDGKLLILGGEYIVHACKESAFEGKSANGIKRIVNSKITLESGVAKLFTANAASGPNFEIKIFEGLNEITNRTTKPNPALTNIKELFGNPVIRNDVGDFLDTTEAEIILSPTQDTEYTISGNFTGKRIISNPSSGVKVDLIVKDFYYESTENGSEELLETLSTNPFWQHTGDKRIKFSINENCLVYIEKDAGAIFATAKNIQFKGKGDMILKAYAGEAITAPNGYTVLGGDGLRCISESLSGISTSSLRFGEDPDDVDEKFATNPSKRGAAECAVYIYGNTQDITLANTEELITYKNQIIATQYHTGISILGSISGDLSSQIIALSGETLQKEGDSYVNAALMYAGSHNLITNGLVHEYVAPVSINDIIPSIEEGTAASWIVYSGDGYSKAQANETFVSKAEHDAIVANYNSIIANLTARIESLESKGPRSTDAHIDDEGVITMNNVEIDEDGVLDLENLATLNDNGSLEL